MISIAGEQSFELVPLDMKKKAAWVGTAGTTLLFGEDDANAGKDVDEIRIDSEDGVALEVAKPKTTPRLVISFSIAIFLLTILHFVRLLNSERPTHWKRILKRFGMDIENERLVKFAYVEPGGRTDFGRVFNLLALNNHLFLLNWLVLMVNPVLYPFERGLSGLRWLAALAWVMVACMGTAVVGSSGRYCKNLTKNWKALGTSEKVSLGFFSFLMIWYLISSLVFLCHWRGDTVREWRRILTLDYGLSPIVPIAAILLAWALWALLQLRRVKWIAYRKMDLLCPAISFQNNPRESTLARI